MIDSKQNVVFPIHPRTVKRLQEFGLYDKVSKSENILIQKTLGYFEILELMKNCSFIVTDSGGLQEEATSPSIRKKVLIVRKTTDRPESVESELSVLVGTNYKKILSVIKTTAKNPRLQNQKMPYGKGDSGKKIVKILSRSF